MATFAYFLKERVVPPAIFCPAVVRIGCEAKNGQASKEFCVNGVGAFLNMKTQMDFLKNFLNF